MNCWAMRTSRDSLQHREFLCKELFDGERLRQGWGSDPSHDLALTQDRDVLRHWRMGNGEGNNYMQIGDLVVVPNMPNDGLFTICRITGKYSFKAAVENMGLGHVRSVKVLTPSGVANNHKLVSPALRRSLRCRSRMWNIKPHDGCLEKILEQRTTDLSGNWTAVQLVEGIVDQAITDAQAKMEKLLGDVLEGKDWESVLQSALERLFPVSVDHVGGRLEHVHGADLEIVIPNPFEEDEDRNWIIPVQVKDHTGSEGVGVAKQLEKAIESRRDRGRVIAVVLLVTDADASDELKARMNDLERQHRVPFIYCTGDRFRRLVSEGFLRHS